MRTQKSLLRTLKLVPFVTVPYFSYFSISVPYFYFLQNSLLMW